jgi:hypothetical protein
VQAIIEEADPLTVLRRYQALVAAGKEIVRTDIPADLLPAFVDLALQVKGGDVRSVAFVRSDEFYPEDPDLDWVRAQVDRALGPPVRRDRGEPGGEPPPPDDADTEEPDVDDPDGEEEDEDPGAAVDLADSCAYDPDGWDADGS